MLNLLLEGEGANASTSIIFIVLIVAIIGMFVWSSISNKKKQKQAQERVNALKKGDRVKTIGGICGFVVEINNAENTFVLETGTDSKKSYVKFDKAAIYQTAPAEGYAKTAENKEATEEKGEQVAEEKAEVKAEETKPVTEEEKKTARKKKHEDIL